MATKLIAPNGREIVGTLERLYGVAMIFDPREAVSEEDKVPVTEGDKPLRFQFEYTGDTKINWDGQSSVMRARRRVFVDTEGNEWTENKLRLVDGNGDPAVAAAAKLSPKALKQAATNAKKMGHVCDEDS